MDLRSFNLVKPQLLNNKLSCEQVVTHFLSVIEKNQHLNVFLDVYSDEAIKRAEEVQKKIDNGTAGTLAGMVVGIKDNICYKGHPSSAGSKILKGFESLFSATVVERMLNEDAIIIGRINCDEFAMGSSNENSAYGPVLNATDNERVPGGSSGGSAVAVQAGMCHVALGSDTGGSVRQPASFCGVYGIKPTYGRVSRNGLIAYASSFDQIGPFSNNLEDMALVLNVISGHDEKDASSSQKPVPDHTKLEFNKKNIKIAVLSNCYDSEDTDPEIVDKMKSITKMFESKGYTINEHHFPYLDYVIPVYQILSNAEASSNLARFAGMIYGHRSAEAGDVDSTITLSRTEGFGEEVKRRIMLGTFVLSTGYYDAYYEKAQKVRRLIKNYFDELLKEHDFIMMPTTPSTAFKLGENLKDPIKMYLEDIFTVPAPIAGLPAISLPLGQHSNGLAFGIQFIGNNFEEDALLGFCRKVEMLNVKE